MSDPSTKDERPSANWKITVVVCLVILLVAGALAALTFSTEPTAQKGGATKKTAMLVDVVGVEVGDYHPNIVATGTVEPARDIVLRPQVGGRVTDLAPAFTPGGFVEAGEVLVKIESADYQHALAQRQSELREALSELAVEKGRQDAARAEYEYLDEDLAPENEALVLRKPQLDAVEQRVSAARAAVEQAELDLKRTTVTAPFDAHIIRREVNVGSQVSPTESIGRLVGVDTYWVSVELPLSKVRWVEMPGRDTGGGGGGGDGDSGSPVRVQNRQAWPKDTYRSGYLYRLVGALDEQTRTARVLAAIPDPLALGADAGDKPPLMIGEYVQVSIQGNQVEDVVRLERDYVRDRDTVWVMEGGKLRVKPVEVAVRDADYAYISSGLDDGAQVVTTNLSTVVDGAPLRLEEADTEPEDEAINDEAGEEESSDE